MPTPVGIIADSYNKPTGGGGPVMTGLIGWWDASDAASITSAANAVSQWNDKSGNNNHATWVNNSWPSTVVPAAINGKAAMDSHPGALQTPIASTLKPITIVAAVKTGAVNTNLSLIGVNNGVVVSGTFSWDVNNGVMRLLRAGVALIGQATSAYTATTPAVLGLNYSSGDVWEHYRDGVQVGTGTQAGTFVNGGMSIGTQVGPNAANYDGLIGELVIYNRVLTTPERQQVEAYLKTKWGTP